MYVEIKGFTSKRTFVLILGAGLIAVRPRTGESRLGFKLKWDAMHNGDTFIDAV
jgi:hypothetical protein